MYAIRSYYEIDEHQLNEARALAERYNALRANRQGN